MYRALGLATLAAIAICCAATTAEAQTKRGKSQQAISAQLQCAKENGAGYDPATKQWMMYATERDAMVRIDAYRACVSRRTGVPQRAVPVHEKPLNTPG